MTFIITDWASNVRFNGKEFESFEDGWDYLSEYLESKGMDFEEWAPEYNVTKLHPKDKIVNNVLLTFKTEARL